MLLYTRCSGSKKWPLPHRPKTDGNITKSTRRRRHLATLISPDDTISVLPTARFAPTSFSPMKCPSCHNSDTSVMDSRVTEEGLAIRRRRECDRCGYRFSTVEEVEILNLAVIKRAGHREPYNREKLENGLRKSLEKRPVTVEDFKRLVGQIERDIQVRGRTEITSHQVGELAMKRLQKMDQVAYIRFASVYRKFQDIESFKRELNALPKQAPRPGQTLRRRTKNAK